MDLAESLLQQNPDSALTVLKSINPQTLSSKKESARYALLMSAALDKNRIDIASDSLIIKAEDYYSQHNNRRYRMLATYYHGIVLTNGGLYPAAIVSLEKAEALASSLNDNYHLGLINRKKANVFNATNNAQEAISSLKKAISFFSDANATSYKVYAELSLAIDYLNNLEYEKSDSLLNCIIKESDDPNLMHNCNLLRGKILTETDANPKEAVLFFQKVPHRYFRMLDCADYALAHEKAGNRDSADFWLKKGYSLCRSQADSAALNYFQSKICIKRGQVERAYFLIDHATSVQDSLTRVLLQQSISGFQRDYYKNENSLQKERMKNMRQRGFIIGFLGLMVLLLILVYFVETTQKKEQQLKEQMAQLLLNKKENKVIKQEKAHLLGSLFSSRIDNLDALVNHYFQCEKENEKNAIFKVIKQRIEALRNDQEAFSALENDLNRYCNDIMSKFREQIPMIDDENLKLISLSFAGIPDSVILLLLNKVSSESIRMARYRLRKVIIASGAPDSDEFLYMLNKKKRSHGEKDES